MAATSHHGFNSADHGLNADRTFQHGDVAEAIEESVGAQTVLGCLAAAREYDKWKIRPGRLLAHHFSQAFNILYAQRLLSYECSAGGTCYFFAKVVDGLTNGRGKTSLFQDIRGKLRITPGGGEDEDGLLVRSIIVSVPRRDLSRCRCKLGRR